CRASALNAFRLGIEWSRVQPVFEPKPSESPAFDEAALEHYAEVLTACRERGLEPVVTLHHFVNPAWLGQDAWLGGETARLFAVYVRTTVKFVNHALVQRGHPPVRYYITVNEPNMLVLNT